MAAPLKCQGCALGHLTNARTLYGEVLKFDRLGNRDLRDRHLIAFLGEIRQAEEQAVVGGEKIREIRKQVESAIAFGRELPDITADLETIGLEMLRALEGNPTLCPTCVRPEDLEHL